ncbi:MAG: DUF4276 family protein [Pseudomonadota bacterium]
MKVVVYVEGPSDVFAMKTLLKPLLEAKRHEGVRIEFAHAGKGDAKAYLLTRVPALAATKLPGEPETTIVVLPDLYPPGKADFKDDSPAELAEGVKGKLKAALARKGGAAAGDVLARFQVFCFKHDLEALLLAVPDRLGNRLGLSSLRPSWRRPVEDQNHAKPPKYVVAELFSKHRKKYDPQIDAPRILDGADYRQVAQSCDQCFKPFVDFLESCGAVA